MRKFAFGVPLTALLLAPVAARLGLPAAAAALAFAPARALASCAMPKAFVAPASGARLPPSPTLYLFSPWSLSRDPRRGPLIKISGGVVSYSVSMLSQTDQVQVYRLDIDSGAARQLDVQVEPNSDYGGSSAIEAHFTIDKAWAKPDHSAPTIVGAEEQVSHWACSYTALQTLTLEGGAPRQTSAYRVDWASANGASSGSAVLPPSSNPFFFYGGTPGDTGDASKASLSLGHVSCLGNTFTWGNEPIDVRVTALFADGSESATPDRAFRVSPPRGALDPEPTAAEPTASAPATPEAGPAAASPPGPKPFAIDPKLGAIAIFGSFVAAALVGFFRRRPRPLAPHRGTARGRPEHENALGSPAGTAMNDATGPIKSPGRGRS